MIWLFFIAALVGLLWSVKMYILIGLAVGWLLLKPVEDDPQPKPKPVETGPRFMPRYPDMSQEYNYLVHLYLLGDVTLERLDGYKLRDWETA